VFLPFDWGYFAFVHDTSLENVPGDFEALAASDVSIVIQDPRSSTPGLGLVMWVQAAYGDRAGEIWAGLADNIVTVTPGWSEAYGLFLDGEADMVLSYTTSPAYHLIAEEDPSKAAAAFARGITCRSRWRAFWKAPTSRSWRGSSWLHADGGVSGGDPDDELDVSRRPACGGVAGRVRHVDHAKPGTDPEPGGGRVCSR
jgi:hypothetical protein